MVVYSSLSTEFNTKYSFNLYVDIWIEVKVQSEIQ